jgi:hypothetical protein
VHHELVNGCTQVLSDAGTTTTSMPLLSNEVSVS